MRKGFFDASKLDLDDLEPTSPDLGATSADHGQPGQRPSPNDFESALAEVREPYSYAILPCYTLIWQRLLYS